MRSTLVLVLVLALLWPAVAVQSQEEATNIALSTPYLGVSVEPGETATLGLSVSGTPDTEVELEVTAVPDEWDATIRGGGFVVDRVLLDEEPEDLELRVDIPAGSPAGSFEVAVTATGPGIADTLTYTLTVAEAVGGDVQLATEFPVLSGPSDVTFTYTLDLDNNTSEEIQFGLDVQGPQGWQLSASPAGQSRASTVTLAGGDSERITVEANPPDNEPAGAYPLLVTASGGGESAGLELRVEITGSFDLTLTTPDERLNVDVVAGEATEMPLLVFNDGTAPLTEVTMSANAPSGWDVTFTPETVQIIEPGSFAEVAAVVTPSEEAIAGDYRITFTSRVPEVSDEFEARATVNTSAFWGFVGVGVIVVALGGLALVFRRFGRR